MQGGIRRRPVPDLFGLSEKRDTTQSLTAVERQCYITLSHKRSFLPVHLCPTGTSLKCTVRKKSHMRTPEKRKLWVMGSHHCYIISSCNSIIKDNAMKIWAMAVSPGKSCAWEEAHEKAVGIVVIRDTSREHRQPNFTPFEKAKIKMSGNYRGQDDDLWKVESCLVGAGNATRVLCKGSQCS